MYAPLNYDQINAMAAEYHPSCIKAYNNQSFAFWERALFQRALSAIGFNLPEEWNGSIKDLFEYIMLTLGFTSVFDNPEYGKTFQPSGLSGYDWYYRPTRSIVTNPALPKTLEMTIGKECEILKLTPDYRGIRDITSYYAEKLALLDNAINMSLINNKFAFILGAKNKAAGEALKKVLDLINEGQPAVILDRKVMDDPNSKDDPSPFRLIERENLKQSYLTTDQLADFRTILHNFDTEIGIPTLPIEKKERMISDEATALETDAMSRSRLWVETFNESAKAVNEHFGLNISAYLTYERREETSDGEADNDRTL